MHSMSLWGWWTSSIRSFFTRFIKHLQLPSFPCVGTSSCVSLSRRAGQQASSSKNVISLPTGLAALRGSATIWLDSARSMVGKETHAFFFHLQNNFLQLLFGDTEKALQNRGARQMVQLPMAWAELRGVCPSIMSLQSITLEHKSTS